MAAVGTKRIARLTAARAQRLLHGLRLEDVADAAGLSWKKLSMHETTVGGCLTEAEERKRKMAIERLAAEQEQTV